MKHLRSSIEDMRRLFERGITVRDSAEPFVSFDDVQSALEVRSFLESKNYDVVGVRCKGMIEAYALRSELGEGKLGDFAKAAEQGTQLSDSAALLFVFELLRDRSWVFVTILDRAWGIVTRGDLHKAPVRMWIFCLISLAEMQMLRIVRNCYLVLDSPSRPLSACHEPRSLLSTSCSFPAAYDFGCFRKRF